MKRKRSVILLLLLAVTGVLQTKAQPSIWVNQANDRKQFELGKLKTITFHGNELSLNFKDESDSRFHFSSVKTLTFSGIQASGISTLANAAKSISLYPTSAAETIYFTNLPDAENNIVIFRTDGTVVMQTRISSSNPTVPVCTLSGGFYLVKINNQLLKFYKL